MGACYYDYSLALQRFCDDSNSACDVCTGYDDLVDSDGDGVPDGCDPCGMVDSQQAFSLKKLDLRLRPLESRKPNRLRLDGQFTLAQPTTELMPDLVGARLTISDSDDYTLFDGHLEPGSLVDGGHGWRVNANRTKWQYRNYDPSACRDGIATLLIRRVSRDVPDLVAFRLIGAAPPDLVEADLPLKAAIILGDQAAADDGLCGEATTATNTCTLKQPPTDLRCR